MQIDKEQVEKLAGLSNMGAFAVVGIIKTSAIYDAQANLKRYLIVDENGEPICFVQPTPAAENIDLAEFLGQKAGLLGEIGPDPKSMLALVRFTDIIKLQN